MQKQFENFQVGDKVILKKPKSGINKKVVNNEFTIHKIFNMTNTVGLKTTKNNKEYRALADINNITKISRFEVK